MTPKAVNAISCSCYENPNFHFILQKFFPVSDEVLL